MDSTEHSEAYLAESRVPIATAFLIIPIVLEILSTAFRLWAKLVKSGDRRVAVDDYLIILATVMAVALCTVALAMAIPNGLGRHVAAIPVEKFPTLRKSDYISGHLYSLAMGFTKLAILTLYYRIFATPGFRKVVIGTTIFVIIWVITLEVPYFTICRPLSALWAGKGGVCLDGTAIALYSTISNIVTDIWIFALPIPKIMKLQGPRDKRLSLCFLFSIGLTTCGMGAGRLHYFWNFESTDSTWDLEPYYMLTVWEPCGGIICANVPLIYRTLKNGFIKVGTSINRGLRSHNTSHNNSESRQGLDVVKDSPKASLGSSRRPTDQSDNEFGQWYQMPRNDGYASESLHNLPQSMREVHMAR